MHDPRESQNGVLGDTPRHSGNSKQRRQKDRLTKRTIVGDSDESNPQDTEPGNALGNKAALIGNAVNCYINASK
jgi:hypothetical protein